MKRKMKKIFVMAGLALSMLLAGCSNDATEDVVSNSKVFTVGIATRTHADGTSVKWNAGDKISVNGVVSEDAVIDASGSSASFTVTGVEAPYTIIYPAEAVNEDGTISLATEQSFVNGSFANGVDVLYAETSSLNVALSHLCGFVKITIDSTDVTDGVKDVAVIANDGTPISGTFRLNNGALEPVAGMDIVRVEGTITYDAANHAVVEAALPAGTYTAGLALRVADANGKALKATLAGTEGLNLAAGVVKNISSGLSKFVADSSAAREILTAADLVEFMGADPTTAEGVAVFAKYFDASNTARIGADIDLTGITLTAVAEFPVGYTFDGQGHSLRNWTSNGITLVTKNSGTIKNIVFDSSCTLNIPNTAHFGFVASTIAASGVVSGCVNNANMSVSGDFGSGSTYFGFVAGANQGTISNCINNGDITFQLGTSTGNNYIGGICGTATGSASAPFIIENCINNGNIYVEVTNTKPGNFYGGGILASTNVAKTASAINRGIVRNCSNTGNYTYKHSVNGSGTYTNIGGCVGYIEGTVDNLENRGTIHFENLDDGTANTTRPSVAGVVGCIIYSASNITNYGTVNISGSFGNGTKGNAGSGAIHYDMFAGVIGCAGPLTPVTTEKIENCFNHGRVNIYANMTLTAGSVHAYGGAIGYSTLPINNVINTGDFIVTTWGKKDYIGGCVGSASANVIGAENRGNVTVVADDIDHTNPIQTYIGGVLGCNPLSITLTDAVNYGIIHSTVTSVNAAPIFNYIGGVVGQYEKTVNYNNCINYGNVISDGAVAVRVGGFGGSVSGDAVDCHNYGNVNVSNAIAPSGKITIVGSFAGYSNTNFTNCSTQGIVTTSNMATDCQVGCLFGQFGGARVVKGIKYNVQLTTDLTLGTQVGFLAGSINSNATAELAVGADDDPLMINPATSINGVAISNADIEMDETTGLGNNNLIPTANVLATTLVLPWYVQIGE